MELEANLTEDGTDVYGKYTPLTARDILTKDLKELREAARELKLREEGGGGIPTATPTATQNGNTTTAPPPETIELPTSALRELEGHTAEILSMSWSPTAGLLATGSADGTARIWDTSTGSSVECSRCYDEMIIGVEWSPDGTTLAGIVASGPVCLWRPDGSHMHTIHNDRSQAATLVVQWSTHGTYLAMGGADGKILIWETLQSAESAHQRHHWQLPGGAPVYDLHWREDVELAAAGEDGHVAVFKIGEVAPVRVEKEHGVVRMEGMEGGDGSGSNVFAGGPRPEVVNMVRWSPSGEFLVSASNDMTIGVWRAAAEASPRLLSGHKREVGWISWSSGGGGGGGESILASGSADGSVRLWNIQNDEEKCRCIGVLDRHEEGITCVSWSPDGNYLVTGDATGNLTVWCIDTSRKDNDTDDRIVRSSMLCMLRCPGQVADVQWVNEGEAVAVGFSGGDSPGLALVDVPFPSS